MNMYNKKEKVFERKILSVDTFKLNDLLGNVKMFVDQVNKTFIPVCLDNGVEPTTELLQKVMTDSTTIQNILAEKIDKDIVSLGAPGKLMKGSLMQAAKHCIEAIEKAVATLQYYELQSSHYKAMAGYGGNNIYPGIEIVDGIAAISQSAMAEYKDQFTDAIETEGQQEVYDILTNIAKNIDIIRTRANATGQIMAELHLDLAYFQIDGTGAIAVNPNIIKYF